MNKFTIISKSPAQTKKIGWVISKNLKAGDVICLFGDFGAGKTVFTKGIASGLGISQEDIISPSFVLMRQHIDGRLPLYHFDLYRMGGYQDIFGLGYEEYLYGQGVVVIEWADKLMRLLPKECLRVELSIREDQYRNIKISAFGSRYQLLLKDVAKIY